MRCENILFEKRKLPFFHCKRFSYMDFIGQKKCNVKIYIYILQIHTYIYVWLRKNCQLLHAFDLHEWENYERTVSNQNYDMNRLEDIDTSGEFFHHKIYNYAIFFLFWLYYGFDNQNYPWLKLYHCFFSAL